MCSAALSSARAVLPCWATLEFVFDVCRHILRPVAALVGVVLLVVQILLHVHSHHTLHLSRLEHITVGRPQLHIGGREAGGGGGGRGSGGRLVGVETQLLFGLLRVRHRGSTKSAASAIVWSTGWTGGKLYAASGVMTWSGWHGWDCTKSNSAWMNRRETERVWSVE